MSVRYPPAMNGRVSPPLINQLNNPYAPPHSHANYQSINQPANQTVNQHVQHSAHPAHGHPSHSSHPYTPHMQHPHQAVNQTTGQTSNQVVNQPIGSNQPVNHSSGNFHPHHHPYPSNNQPSNGLMSHDLTTEPATLDWQWFDSFAFQPTDFQQHHHHQHSNQPISQAGSHHQPIDVEHSHHATHATQPINQPINHASGAYTMPVQAIPYPTGYSADQMLYSAADRPQPIGTSPLSYGRVVQMAQPAVAPTVAYATFAAPAVKRKPRRKLACSNCRHVKSECSGERPCRRCVRLNKAHTCADPTEPYPPKKPKTKKEPKETDNVKQEKKEQSTDGDDDEDGDGDEDGDAKEKDLSDANGDSQMSPDSIGNARSLGDNANDDEEPRESVYAVPSAYHHCIGAFSDNFTRTPIQVTPQSTIGIIRRMGHLFETMPPGVFELLLTRMGYVSQNDTSSVKEEPRDPMSSPLSNNLIDMDALDDHSHSSNSSGVSSGRIKKTIWRSPHAHLPYVSLPHRFRLNWSLTPVTAFDTTESLCQTFPTLMWMHYPPAAHFVRQENGSIVPCPIEGADYPVNYTPDNPLPSLQEGQVPLEPHEIDLSATEQFGILLTNSSFERLFGYTQHEMKRMFDREGKRAFVRLFESNIHSTLGNDMKRLNQEGTTEFRHFAVIRTKFNTTLPVLMLRKLLVDQDGFVLINRYTFISMPGVEELPILQNHFTGSSNTSSANTSSSPNESVSSFTSS